MKHVFSAFLACLLFVSCGQADDSAQAQRLLSEARTMLAQRQYAEARSTILALRQQYPRAIDGRQQALLLLDSIEWQAAADTLMNPPLGCDTEELKMRIKFYQRSLEEHKKLLESKNSK